MIAAIHVQSNGMWNMTVLAIVNGVVCARFIGNVIAAHEVAKIYGVCEFHFVSAPVEE